MPAVDPDFIDRAVARLVYSLNTDAAVGCSEHKACAVVKGDLAAVYKHLYLMLIGNSDGFLAAVGFSVFNAGNYGRGPVDDDPVRSQIAYIVGRIGELYVYYIVILFGNIERSVVIFKALLRKLICGIVLITEKILNRHAAAVVLRCYFNLYGIVAEKPEGYGFYKLAPCACAHGNGAARRLNVLPLRCKRNGLYAVVFGNITVCIVRSDRSVAVLPAEKFVSVPCGRNDAVKYLCRPCKSRSTYDRRTACRVKNYIIVRNFLPYGIKRDRLIRFIDNIGAVCALAAVVQRPADLSVSRTGKQIAGKNYCFTVIFGELAHFSLAVRAGVKLYRICFYLPYGIKRCRFIFRILRAEGICRRAILGPACLRISDSGICLASESKTYIIGFCIRICIGFGAVIAGFIRNRIGGRVPVGSKLCNTCGHALAGGVFVAGFVDPCKIRSACGTAYAC